jgi:hypothetical protein
VDVKQSSIPGVPEATQEWEDYDGWTAGAVRTGIEAIATATDENPKELFEVATDSQRGASSARSRRRNRWSGISSR